MKTKFKGLTNHPNDRKILASQSSLVSKDKKYSGDNPPFISIDTDNKVTINYFDKSVDDYIEVITTLNPEEAQKMTEQELDNLAYSLLRGEEAKVLEKYKLKSVEIPIKRAYTLTGNSSVKTLNVGVFASTSEDERALHYLLDKVRATL